MKDCYSVTQYSVQHILKLITSGDIAITEIQRPFVWDSTKVSVTSQSSSGPPSTSRRGRTASPHPVAFETSTAATD